MMAVPLRVEVGSRLLGGANSTNEEPPMTRVPEILGGTNLLGGTKIRPGETEILGGTSSLPPPKGAIKSVIVLLRHHVLIKPPV